ncbi:beta-lactamase-like protein, transpeptidase superfamily [Psychroflexus torquis ATCC 700755]|uniref:Beta-lactamase-like protein, transpeptidase superfamily n=1 Tax=Psychroflexus torquis (strain ATCC 700755 / CIP 106069 / ACAM 623) TaxID=313595 RepID=K4IRW6_PSYTT|nr:serine hydrolase domain-containing protein [Psychroflexus torquis]AFU68215.1 beta-lactamase-like protein, transpeptidase superfamily [Psychroflexus torquis ATCC 700755]
MKLFFLICLAIMLGFSSYAQSLDEKIHQTLKNYLTEFPSQTQFSVALIDHDDTYYYGQVKFSDTINQLDNSASLFQIGSVTKVFTSTLLASLVLDKTLKLTDSLQQFFRFPLANTSITLERLSNHTSGLPRLPSNLNLALADPKNPYLTYTEADLEFYLTSEMEVPNTTKPIYQYSNLGAGILANALENATDKTFDNLLSEKIFQPLGMKNSTLDSNLVESNLVQGLDQDGNPTPVWDMGVLAGAGGVLSSTADLSKFVKAHFEDTETAFSLTTLSTFLVNANLRIGLGWHILQDERGHNLYWHNGGTGGYSASVFVIPEIQKAVIVLTNVSAFHPKASRIDELGFKLLSAF